MADERRVEDVGTPATPAAQNADDPHAPDALTKDVTAHAKPLTPEEQMALYEEKLKEEDWGHQPC